jgi:signal transduction histidine kinase/FixJ family two-component response regulator
MDKKILLVDDEEGIRKVLGISLADDGYQVLTAENGAQAFDIFKQEQPAVVLTDIKMPVMDGITLLKRVKQENPDTEVIMLTGHGDMDLAIQCLKLEAMDFITKPINADVLSISLTRAYEKILMKQKLKEYTLNLEKMVEEKSARLVEAERLAAVGQAMEGLSSAFKNIAGDLSGSIKYFNEMPCLVSIHSRKLKIITANQLHKDRLGDQVGHDSWRIYEAPQDSAATCPVAATFQSGQGLRCRANIRLPDGSLLPVMVHTAPIRAAQGEVQLVVEIAADIVEIQRLQEDLRISQQHYHQLFDEAPCYITVQDRSLRITAANRRFLEDFDLHSGSCCFSVYKHRENACPECPVAKTFADGHSHQCEMEVTAKNGEKYQVLVWTAPIRNAAGQIDRVMEMSTNITQVRKLQDQLSSLGLLIGSVSHGIKGLLTGLDGGMYLLDSGFAKENQEQIKEGWEIVRFMAGRIRSMVLDILYYAKQRDLNWEKVDVLSFANEVARTAEAKIKAASIVFATDFEATAGAFEVDAGIVRSALSNILENALEACLEDHRPKVHKIQFSVRQKGEFIEFVVQDSGIGMDDETRKKVFTPFFSSKGHKGTGLGLFISNRIIRQHGGEIGLVTQPGQGACFTIRMPKTLPKALKINSQKQSPGDRGDSIYISA